jgi:hypothetical protein
VKLSDLYVKVERTPLLDEHHAEVYGQWPGLTAGDLADLKAPGCHPRYWYVTNSYSHRERGKAVSVRVSNGEFGSFYTG